MINLAQKNPLAKNTVHLALVVQMLDSAFHWLYHCTVEKYLGNQ